MYKIFEELLKERGVTAYQVAQATGIETATLTHWKQGLYTPKVDKIMLIANYFGVPLETFYGNKEIKDADNAENEDGISEED